MNKIKLDIIGLSSSHAQSGHFALVLGEENGNRKLPIIIGGPEAQAIALEMEGISTNRPMTHDLIFNIARHFEINLIEVVINDLREGIFRARLILEYNGEIHEIDSRPSDAVAIGVRFKAPIFTYEKVLDEAGIVVDQEDEESEEEGGGSRFSIADVEQSDPLEEDSPRPRRKKTGKDRKKFLEKKLGDAIAAEDYETAAQIRDEISRLGGDS